MGDSDILKDVCFLYRFDEEYYGLDPYGAGLKFLASDDYGDANFFANDSGFDQKFVSLSINETGVTDN